MKIKKYIHIIIPTIISFFCIYLVYRNIDFKLFFLELFNTNYRYVLIASFLLVLTVFIRSIRWKILLNKDILIYDLFKTQMIGYFANNVLFLRLGEVLKSYLLGEKERISKSYVFGTVIVERFLDMLMLLLMIFIYIAIVPSTMDGELSVLKILLIVSVILGVFLLLLLNVSKFPTFSIKIIEDFISNFSLAYKNLSLKQVIYSNFLGIINWIIYWICVDLIFKAFQVSVNIDISLLILIIASLIASIPSLPGAIGTFHLGVNLTLSSLNVIESSSLLPFITILHGYGYIVLTLIGLHYFIVDKKLGIKHLISFSLKSK